MKETTSTTIEVASTKYRMVCDLCGVESPWRETSERLYHWQQLHRSSYEQPHFEVDVCPKCVDRLAHRHAEARKAEQEAEQRRVEACRARAQEELAEAGVSGEQ